MSGGARPATEPGAIDGQRLLYEGRSESTGQTHRFRLAVALAPPDRIRLEVLPPVGGPRLVVIADDRRLIALDPAHRRAETWDPERDGVARLLGASMGTGDLRLLLQGRSPCGADAAGKPAVECPFAGGRYRSTGSGDGGAPRRAEILDAAGTPRLLVEYPASDGDGEAWTGALQLRRPGAAASITLTRITGPTASRLDPELFSTERPARFEQGAVLGGEGLANEVAGEETPP